VKWAGLTGNGLYQINAVIAVAEGDAAVEATIGGVATGATTWIPISATRQQLVSKVA